MYRRGIVVELDAERCRARVKFPDRQDADSGWLDVLGVLPDTGEQVACLLDENAEAGAVLGPVGPRSVARWPLGGVALHVEGAAEFVALAQKTRDALTALKDAISNAVPTPMDGGAGLKTTIMAALAAWPPDVGSEVLKSD